MKNDFDKDFAQFAGIIYSATGKMGHNIKTGYPSKEYSAHVPDDDGFMEKRIWVDSTGNTTED